jgi:hypothetical protein
MSLGIIPQNNIKVKSFAVIARKTPLSSNRTHEPPSVFCLTVISDSTQAATKLIVDCFNSLFFYLLKALPHIP